MVGTVHNLRAVRRERRIAFITGAISQLLCAAIARIQQPDVPALVWKKAGTIHFVAEALDVARNDAELFFVRVAFALGRIGILLLKFENQLPA